MNKPKKRYNDSSERRIQILDAAMELAGKIGYQNITREMVATAANTSCALVTWYFSPMESLKRIVMATAIEREILPIIAQGLSLGDEQTLTIRKELKQKVLVFLNN